MSVSLKVILLLILVFILAGASILLWWKFSRARQLNTQLQSEIVTLRSRLRALRH